MSNQNPNAVNNGGSVFASVSLSAVSTRAATGLVNVMGLRSGDFNGDGVVDLQAMASPGYGGELVGGGPTVYVSNANGILFGQSGSLSLALNGGNFGTASSSQAVQFSAVNFVSTFADFDGNGATDLATAAAGTSLVVADGSHSLSAANVANLVSAMASFSPPTAGQMTLAAAGLDDDLNTTLAANWA